MANEYATIEEFFGDVPGAETEDPAQLVPLTRRLTSASRAIDTYTRRASGAFSPSPEDATERVVYGTGEAVLPLSEFVPASVVTVTTALDGYMPEAWREYRRGSVRGLHTASSAGRLTQYETWADGVPYAVTARWGYEAIPADINEACIMLAARWHRAKDDGFSGVIGGLTQDRTIIERAFPPAVKQLLDPFVEAPEDEDSRVDFGRLAPTDFN